MHIEARPWPLRWPFLEYLVDREKAPVLENRGQWLCAATYVVMAIALYEAIGGCMPVHWDQAEWTEQAKRTENKARKGSSGSQSPANAQCIYYMVE